MNGINDLTKEAEKVLRAGLEESIGAYKEEFTPFVSEFAPLIADLSMRAVAGDKDAVESLVMLREQALTHEYIARRAATVQAQRSVKQVVGTAIRFVVASLGGIAL